MNKIVKSLSVIAFVAAIAIGATSSYFSDEEKVSGNTITAGTIDIQLDGTNSVTTPYTVADVKPGETGYMNIDVKNVGTNPVKVSKNLSNFVVSGGTQTFSCPTLGTDAKTSSEPECAAEGTTRVDDLRPQIIYDLRVDVYANNSDQTPIWWQTIYTDAENKTLSTVYPEATTFVALGTIPPGGHMKVTQSYHFNYNARNEYQGDVLSFDITIKGEQESDANGMTTVALENKAQGADSNWNIVEDGVYGTLNYKTQGSKFDYNFTGRVNTTGNYTLIYVGPSNNYPASGSVALGSGEFTAGSDGALSGQVVTGDITSGKIWLIPTSSYVGGIMTSWPAADILFETGLINYNQN